MDYIFLITLRAIPSKALNIMTDSVIAKC